MEHVFGHWPGGESDEQVWAALDAVEELAAFRGKVHTDMTVSELLPTLSDLSRADKFRVVEHLVTELAEEDGTPTIPPGTYSIWSPYDAHEAASAMMAALAEDKSSRQS